MEMEKVVGLIITLLLIKGLVFAHESPKLLVKKVVKMKLQDAILTSFTLFTHVTNPVFCPCPNL